MKTKEMLIDYRKNSSAFPYLFIDGVRVERMIEFKYLETVLGNKLNFNSNKNFIHKKNVSQEYSACRD